MNLKMNSKILIIVVAIIVLGVLGYLFSQRKFNSSDSTSNGSNLIGNTAGQVTQAVIFSRNIVFTLPSNHIINIDASPGSVVVFSKDTSDYSIGDYQSLLAKKAIVIQSYAPLNKNDTFFKNYITQKYRSTDQIESKVDFEKINGYESASVNIKHKDKDFTEYLKIVNLESPVIIAAAQNSKELSTIANTIKNLDQGDKSYADIRQQVQLIGTLMKSDMSSELYSLFSAKYRKTVTVDTLKNTLADAKENLKKAIIVNGGLLMTGKNEFLVKPVFKNLQDKTDVQAGQIKLTKEGNQWLVSEFIVPKDSE